MIKLLIGSVLAAAIGFMWGFLSWTVLDLHGDSMAHLSDQPAATTVAGQMPENKIYMFPPMDESITDPTKQHENWTEKAAAGPYLFAYGRAGAGGHSMTAAMIWDFGTRLVGSFIVGLLLLSAKNLRYLGRAFFVAFAGLFAGVVAYTPLWTWFEFPAPFLRMMALDQFVSWLLAGLVLAIFIRENIPTSRA